MILNVIKEDYINLNVEAEDWEDAIRKASEPLCDTGAIECRYVDAIISSAKENGPYFVLIPHVALPHARTEEGAIKNAIGIASLKTPVKFHNEANDPVKYLFVLSSTTEDKHLEIMAELSMLLESKDFYDVIDNAKSSDEIIRFIEKEV